MIDEVDENESGSIDFDEFLVMVANKLKETDCTNENLREAFKVIFHNVIWKMFSEINKKLNVVDYIFVLFYCNKILFNWILIWL